MKIQVKIKNNDQKQYNIIVGTDILKNLNEYLKTYVNAGKYLIVTNETVWNLYSDKIKIDNASVCILKDGEKYKNIKSLTAILDKAFKENLDRYSCMIALGGGVIGDMTGFAASIYKRSIDFVQIPTTLLAQTDASIGGKTGINNEYGKNLIGAFYQPKLIVADTNTLNTLDERQFKTGLAEVVKYAFIEKNACGKSDFIEYLEKNYKKILKRDKKALEKIILTSMRTKIKVVEKDEKESGLRMILNFGHTFAHALEKYTDYKKYTHGEAVAIGMQVACDIAFAMNKIDEELFDRYSNLLNLFEFNIPKTKKNNVEEIIDIMRTDKKNKNGNIVFVLPNDISDVYIEKNVKIDLLKKIIS